VLPVLRKSKVVATNSEDAEQDDIQGERKSGEENGTDVL
jgi:hypothetical protein